MEKMLTNSGEKRETNNTKKNKSNKKEIEKEQ